MTSSYVRVKNYFRDESGETYVKGFVRGQGTLYLDMGKY
jgi:hypothetical protein